MLTPTSSSRGAAVESGAEGSAVRFVLLLAGLAIASGGCAARAPDVLGRPVTLVPKAEGGAKAKGELLAVDQGRIWVRTKEGVREFDPAALREVRVRRHGLGGRWALRWGLIGGFLSGVALTAACSSVEGNSSGGCAAVGAGTAAVWMLVGAAAAPGLDASSQLRLAPGAPDLRSYARLPAGFPAGGTPGQLEAGPPAPK
jgi:hypothetical protein